MPSLAAPRPRQAEWCLWHEARSWTVNQERAQKHWKQRSGPTKEWRDAFYTLAKQERIPHLDRARIIVVQHRADRRRIDLGACFPAVKAAIDGITDAGVLDDDDSEHMIELTFACPVIDGRTGIALWVIDAG